MALNLHDKALITAIEDGLPLVSQPYEAVGNMIGLSETAVIERLENLIATGVISRFGVVVNHRRVGYRATRFLGSRGYGSVLVKTGKRNFAPQPLELALSATSNDP